jgi:hypothetical protein
MATKLAQVVIAGTLALSLSASASANQDDGQSPGAAPATSQTLREAIRRSALTIPQASVAPSPAVRRGQPGRVSLVRKARSHKRAWICLGAAGGMIAGGYLGMKIEGDGCRCDDPGLKGYAIGMPIGGLLGGLAGALIASR